MYDFNLKIPNIIQCLFTKTNITSNMKSIKNNNIQQKQKIFETIETHRNMKRVKSTEKTEI